MKTCSQSLSASTRTMSSKLWDRKGVLQHSTYLQDQMSLSPQVSPCLPWILNFCSLTLLRRHCLTGWVGQQLLFWGSRRSQVSPCLPFNMFTWHCYGIGIYPTPQVSPCLSNHTVAWHSWKCHGWWSRRAWGRRRMINFLPWRCHGCWRGQAWGRRRR